MSSVRAQATATLLNDGRLTMIGGTGSGRSQVTLVEVWDPSTVAGGSDSHDVGIGSAELLGPVAP